MGVIKIGPELVVDHLITRQLVTMDDFWSSAPPGLLDDLKPIANEAATKAMQIAMGQNCSGCTGGLRGVLAAIHNPLWCRIADAKAADVDLSALVAFVTAKRGYRPKPIIAYYKDSDGAQRRVVL